jgi:excisionase family DNA binding protein
MQTRLQQPEYGIKDLAEIHTRIFIAMFDGTRHAVLKRGWNNSGRTYCRSSPRFIMKPDRDQSTGMKTCEPKFSMKSVAELIGVHVSTVSRLMDSCKLGYYQIGKRRIVGESHLQKYLTMTERKAKPGPLRNR